MRPGRFRIISVVCAALVWTTTSGDALAATHTNDTPAQKLVQRAQTLFNGMEYLSVLPLTEEVLSMKSVAVSTQLEAYLLQGSSLAIVGNPAEAEKSFRFLLRGTPDYKMPLETSPKITAIFSRVQTEEKAIREMNRALRRASLLKEMKLLGEPKPEVKGGTPIEFGYNLKDRRGVVSSFRVHYRRESDLEFSSLPLNLNDAGRWLGAIPGQWSDNEEGFNLQYFLITADDELSPLITRGDADTPLTLLVLPGTVAEAAPFYQQNWFWVTLGASVAAVVGAGWYATNLPYSKLDPPLKFP